MLNLIKHWQHKRRQRERAARRSCTDVTLQAAWQRVWNSLPFLERLSAEDREQLRELALIFLREKEMHGAAGFALTDEIRLSIAVQACLPILRLGLRAYTGWVGIVVYPAEFRVTRSEADDDGVVHEWVDELAGEAWPGGPVVLSWQDIDSNEPGYNVVIHEFAHKLDMLSGDADGIPPAPKGYALNAWQKLFSDAYERFCAEIETTEEVETAQAAGSEHFERFDFDPYAAEHPAEFFAVMSEAFFTEPEHLRKRFPLLYNALAAFYEQAPAA